MEEGRVRESKEFFLTDILVKKLPGKAQIEKFLSENADINREWKLIKYKIRDMITK